MSDWWDKKQDREMIEAQKRNNELLERMLKELIAIRKGQGYIVAEEAVEIAELSEIAHDLRPKLSFLKLAFGGKIMQGPVTLTPTTPTTKATVLGFNADGSPFTGTMPAATYTPDVTTFDTFTADGANGLDIAGVADGTTNLTVSLTTAEGLALSDSSSIVTSGFTVTPPPQVLASIKLDFSQPK